MDWMTLLVIFLVCVLALHVLAVCLQRRWFLERIESLKATRCDLQRALAKVEEEKEQMRRSTYGEVVLARAQLSASRDYIAGLREVVENLQLMVVRGVEARRSLARLYAASLRTIEHLRSQIPEPAASPPSTEPLDEPGQVGFRTPGAPSR